MKSGWIVGALLLSGCANKPAPVPNEGNPKPTVQTGPTNEITVTDPLATPSAWLSNGLVGIRINRRGDCDGEPVFTTTNYESRGEEKIVAQPPYAPPIFLIDDKLPVISELQDYKQTLNMGTGALTTQYRWRDHFVESVTAFDPENGVIYQRSVIKPKSGVSVYRSGQYYPVGSPKNVGQPRGLGAHWPIVTDYDTVFPSARTVQLARTIQTSTDPSYYSGDPLAKIAAGYSRRPQIQIEGDPVSERYARSLDFYLRQSVNAKGTMSVGPMGLSSAQYNGHIFWDADIWVFPALALLDPERAKAIPNYRLRMLPAAKTNFLNWFSGGRPTARGDLGTLPMGGKILGAKYPWESSVSGQETVPGPSKYEDHITGSIAWSLRYGAKLGIVDAAKSAEITRLAGWFYLERMSPKGILGTMSPDENHIGDNDLYTNIVAQLCIDQLPLAGERTPLPLPKDDKSFLTYDGDPVRGYKQSAAVLAIYPLQYPPAEKQASAMLERFMNKVSKNGPAMSDSVHATILARLGRPEEAYELWNKDQAEFANHPLMLFSEKRSKPVTYFVTGAGGWMQTLLYGFLGLRLDDQPLPNAAWKLRLKSGAFISAIPHLPKAWKKLSVTVTLDGQQYRIEATNQKFTATPVSGKH